MKRILYLADPKLIHDQKWITYFSSQSEKYECYLIVRQHHKDLYKIEDFSDIEQTFKCKFLGCVKDFSIRNFMQTYQQGQIIKNWISQYKIDIFHILYAEPNILWANLSLPKGVQCLVTSRGTDVLKTIPEFDKKSGILPKLVYKLYQRAFERCQAITSTSIRQINSINAISPSSKNKTHLVRTGVDLTLLDAAEKPLPADLESTPFILFPRNMRPLYNHEMAIEALKLLPSDLREKYTAVFVHRNSNDKVYVAKIEKALSELSMKYVFLDFVPSEVLYSLYKKAEAIVMTPLSDGTPVSAIEAMALGRQLILSPLDYDADIFQKDAVQILKTWEPTELAIVLANVLNKKVLSNTEKAAHLARTLANRNIEMEKLQTLYENPSLKPTVATESYEYI